VLAKTLPVNCFEGSPKSIMHYAIMHYAFSGIIELEFSLHMMRPVIRKLIYLQVNLSNRTKESKENID
jgi:hypothetical protein